MLQLLDEIAGEQYHPSPDGVMLIGSDRHCHCRLAEIPRVAAVLVRFDEDDWVLYDVRSSTLQLNGHAVSSGVALCDGDLLQLAQVRLRVLGMKPLRRDRCGHLSTSPCSVECTAADGATLSAELHESCLIGTAQICGLVFPPSSRLKTRQCLVVPHNHRWFLVNLTAGLCQHVGGRKWQWVSEVQDKDVVRLGHLRVSFRLNIASREVETDSGARNVDTDPAQAIFNPATAASAVRGDFEKKSDEESVSCPTADGTPEINVAGPKVGVPPLEVAPIQIDDELVASAQDIFNTIKARQLVVPPTAGMFEKLSRGLRQAGELAGSETDFVEGRRLRALSRLKKLLSESPWNRSLLMSFARMCDIAGLLNLCLQTLNLVHRQLPKDVVVLKSMARVSLQLAKNEPRYYELSTRYWKRVQSLCPQEHHQITTTIRNISAEQLMAYQFFEKV